MKEGIKVIFFNWFKRRKQTEIPKVESAVSPSQTEEICEVVDFRLPVTEEEKELVSLITGVVASEHESGKVFRITNVSGIDTEKEIVSTIVGAIAAKDEAHANFKITKIERVN